MKKVIVFAMLVVLLASVPDFAGENPTIPKFILLEADQVKTQVAYNQLAVAFKQAAGKACPHCYWLAFSPLTGAAGQVTYAIFQNSWAEIQSAIADFRKIRNEVLTRNPNLAADMDRSQSRVRNVIAQFSPGMSLNPDKIDAPHVTMWRVTTFQLKPAQNTPFAELAKQTAELHKQANDNAQWLAYTIVAGEPGPTVLFLRPLHDLAELDQPESPEFIALMTPEMRKHFNEVMAQTEAANETNFYIADPVLSRPPREYLTANPGFWLVKEPASAPTGKESKKGVKPADMKENKMK